MILKKQKLCVGDRIKLSGGYDMDPKWLCGKAECFGELIRFIPGQNSKPAAVVKLDNPITVDHCTGYIIVLELRYEESSWSVTDTVHIELCDFEPESKSWKERKQGLWVESNATFKRQ